MKRFYYIGDDVELLEAIETDLEKSGINRLQIHVLSLRDAEIETHKLHEVASFMKQDVVHSSIVGAAIGVGVSALFLFVVHALGFTESAVGWMPFIFVAIVLFGFCTWEGGLRGIQEPNHHFARFQDALQAGRHVLFVDVDSGEETILERVLATHPAMEAAGVEPAGSHRIVEWRQKAMDFVKTLP